MGSIRTFVRHIQPGTVIAALALFIAIGGTATAASGLINGKKIKKGTVTAKQIKNKTITKSKLAPSTVSALKGQAGPAGAAGATGPAGATGTTGPAGIVVPETAVGSAVDLQSDTLTEVVSLDLDPGSYMFTARATIVSHASGPGALLGCSLAVDEVSEFDLADSVDQYPVAFNQSTNLPLLAVASVQEKVTVICSTDVGLAHVSASKIIAVPVQG